MTLQSADAEPTDRSVTITSARLFSAPAIYAAPTRAQSVLHPAQRRVVDAFNGTAAMKEEIAERSQYSVTSSGFEKTLSQLSSIGVVTRPAPGMVDLADWVRELV